MIGWPLSFPCAVAWRFGESSQQPTFPEVMHMRRCTHELPIFRHSSQPSSGSGSSVTSIWSRWLQMGVADIRLLSSSLLGPGQDEREVAGPVGPPLLHEEPGASKLRLEPLTAELAADLDAEALVRLEREPAPEAAHRDDSRAPRPQPPAR